MDFGFRISDFGFRISAHPPISDSGFRISNFEFSTHPPGTRDGFPTTLQDRRAIVGHASRVPGGRVELKTQNSKLKTRAL
jgi:hypothetical protein